MKKNISIICLFFMFQIGFGQEITILDMLTKEPIVNVKVEISGGLKVYSNSQGIVTIDGFKIKDKIYFSHTSYKNEILTITEIVRNNYTLLMVDKTLPEIIIKPKREYTYEDYSSVRLEKIGKMKDLKNPQTSADMLQNDANVMVQKSQAGGGSPVIRGFEANKILLVVDGVRMNNAIYRSGHLQNAITVDNNILESTDVFYGPGSVIYGSDALGGVIHFHTRNPELSRDTNALLKLNYLTRVGTANGENTNHFDLNYGRNKWGSLTSVTYSSFEDMKMGANRSHGYNDFGKINYFVKTENNIDSVYENSDKNLHKRTAYNQIDLTQKFTYSFNKKLNLGLNIQYSTSSKINRFDRLNQYTNNQLKYAEWYYGPQKRLLASLKLESKYKTKIYDYYTIIGAFQKIDEDRISRRLNNSKRTTNEEDVNVYSLNSDFLKQINSKEVLYYGVELTHNSVKSFAETEDIFTNFKSPTYTRYPSNGSEVFSSAVYATIEKSILKDFSINLGGRYSRSFYQSSFVEAFNFGLPFTDVTFNSGAFSGSFSLKYEEEHGFHGELIGSSGFRAPNVDDYGKIFEKDGYLVVPNIDLQPEFVKNGELNFSKKWIKNEKEYLMVKVAGFYTAISDAIVRSDFTLNGNDSIVFDGSTVKIQANQNINSAHIYGTSFDVRVSFTPYLSFNGSVNYTVGDNITEESPLAHIPPLFGRMSLTYVSGKLQIQARSLFNGMKNIEDFSTGTTDNPSEATIDGSPAWSTYSLTGSYKIWKQLKIQVSIENILDTHYKQFSSGISGMGRNFSVSLSGNF